MRSVRTPAIFPTIGTFDRPTQGANPISGPPTTAPSALPRNLQRIVDTVRRQNADRPIPRATYRVQFHAGFTFADATKRVPYLRDLGISHLYASPIFRAVPGSMHGYDVIDQNQLNPEIGSQADFDALVQTLHRHGLGLIVDIVPNHMGIARGCNPWWQDVLENGRFSPFVHYFDIDWEPLKSELRHKVLLPVLGDQYGVVLENGELHLTEADGSFTVWYYDTPLPIAPPTYSHILREALPDLQASLDPDDFVLLEVQSIIPGLERLPTGVPSDADEQSDRLREQTIAKERIRRLLAESPQFRLAVDSAITRFNGIVGDPGSFDLFDRLLDAQAYRLAFWRVAAEEINYRRFFAINDLAAIRQEVPEVFAATHRLLMDLVESGAVDGLRIDHPDGLWDPGGYMRELQRAAFLARCRAIWLTSQTLDDWPEAESAMSAWWDFQIDCPEQRSVYLVVEKILAHGESLRSDWPVDGTVGYDFLAENNNLLVDPANKTPFDRLYASFTGADTRFADISWETRNIIMRVALTSEVNVLVNVLNIVSEHDRRTRDFTLNDLRNAVRSVIACFPNYRTYRGPEDELLRQPDRTTITQAVREAMRRNPAQDHSVYDFILHTLTARVTTTSPTSHDEDRRRFDLKLQQLTGPVMAKGLEDTAFYRFNRLTSLNEVGGEPVRFGSSIDDFHAAQEQRQMHWPSAMLASSTHDTKRSEDVRARIAVLSEIPRDWRASLNRWAKLNRKHRSRFEGAAAPVRADEYLLYQTMLGIWPATGIAPETEFVDRVTASMIKAIREGQERSNWSNPVADYESALETFIRRILDPGRSADFLADFGEFQARVNLAGWINSLASTVLKLTVPGVPDLYQGTELLDFSLVDPDNRRPVNYIERSSMLRLLRRRKIGPQLIRDLAGPGNAGLAKLHVTTTLLELRRTDPALFTAGAYAPIRAVGSRQKQVLAFSRTSSNRTMVVVTPHLIESLLREGDGALSPNLWTDTHLEYPGLLDPGPFHNIFTGETVTAASDSIPIGAVFGSFPVAVLISGDHQ